MGSEAQELRFLLIPLMSQSHLLPFTGMAKHLAAHGVSVTVVMTPLNALRYKSVLDHARTLGLAIHFLTLPFPCKEAGLPEGCENIDSLPSSDLMTAFFDASNMLQGPLEKRLEAMEDKPSCIVTDICFPWTTDVALKFGLPRIVFHTISCFTLLCSHSISRSDVMGRVKGDDEPFVVPGLPDKIEFTKAQLPQMMKDGLDDLEDLLDTFKAAELTADGVLVNSFEKLEKNYVKCYQKVVKKLWCIGPLSLSPGVDSAKLDRGNKPSIDPNRCLDWLDSRDPKSVLYVCFGSLCHVSASQLVELALGLEASRCCFMWVIRKGDHSQELEKWLSEYGFEERTPGRGLIIRGWAPQVMILSHPSVGGFMTHCGWNSTLEAVTAGVPMITWPMFAEQFYNEKQIVQVLRIGVSLGVRRPAEWGEEEKGGVMVSREAVQHAIGRLMDEGEEGAERRLRVKELGEAARRAVEEGGSSYLNMSLMIHYVRKMQNRKRSMTRLMRHY
ncbi:UDP-glycosyltransferase 73C3-like [Rhodamnia argentea]|uniref:Glycosyltransferase n=1 Tax=Rhodamnia argentea TaxID=178133 RepID=A0A8B8NHJ0_9MYRT|nr:UDP-glycosyltransferase 73C3-like [Rhodamnia argentea]